jgi:predicted glycoside hydrolase/deacetylase ChbG (UPF0249 family)
MRQLIVNADDFGMTPGVSEGILSAHARGIVTSTTALVTGSIPSEHLARAREAGIGVGLHVNFTFGRPLTGARSLTDGDGRFLRDARRAAAVATASEVEREVKAQLDRFVTLFKRPPTHLDTHHHVGIYPPVREVVLEAAVRLRLAVRSQDESARARARAAGVATADHFFGESGPGAYWSPARTLAHLRALPDGVSEFMTHPGRFDADLAPSRYGRQREIELVGLGTPAARGAAHALGIRLCHFGQL